jgi:hypothetical protein
MTTELMKSLRRSPRSLLERSGLPGAGPGSLSLVLARAGTGKTAFLTGIGLDALLAGQKVLHVSLEANVEKVRDWYDELLDELLRLKPSARTDYAEIHGEIDRDRHIQCFLDGSFDASKLEETIGRLARRMSFRPQVIVIDRLDLEKTPHDEIAAMRDLAARHEAELWTSSRVYRRMPETRDGHLPQPAESIEDLCDLVLRLVSEGPRVRLHVLKDHGEIIDRNLEVLLDPTTLLLVPEADVTRG